ncbi:chromate efflux transporter [Marinomonas posidonica]|uniref:Chromate transporter, chromate ion transporter (CHR) family n=1 Tax=Marinomonas posidonica (strain CECT 7376 / NCIMB 14433 / IVIA-Po-181) TaxID=491952 RepID=F6CZ35_MARPP|nr:chromate efflux transporter [Marinomonas posidonica]AEF53491.1 chromate transporter, chromate ion transporter (CHR) family [Marinomonas posidonica IVIA-Po-181]
MLDSAKQNSAYLTRVVEIFSAFFLLGWTSFGGPAAHLGYFNQVFVQQRKWVVESQYAQWVALSQIVPGPGSSQVGFALGYHRAGLLGGIVAFIAFTSPSFMIMVLLAQFGHIWQGDVIFTGVVHALKLLAVVVVADACLTMWRSFCQSRLTVFLALFSTAILIWLPMSYISLVVLIVAAVVSILLLDTEPKIYSALPSVPMAGLFFCLAILLFVLSFFLSEGLGQLFADFYQAGALVFGGGHVVLPMLSAFVADTVSNANLLIGYAAAQAVPGPMFTMASFLGAASAPEGTSSWLWALVATLAVFLCGLLLMLSAQGVWQKLSDNRRFLAAVAGLNAAVVGILLAALYHPIGSSSVLCWQDALMVVVGFVWLKWKRPSILFLILAFVLLGVLRGSLG